MKVADFNGKKVLIMGLGLLGGGVASTKWFVRRGAKVTVTDLKTNSQLKDSIGKLGGVAKKVQFVLGRHRVRDFKENDVVVVNPGVPKESKFLEIAKGEGKLLVNDALVFFECVKNPIVAITGTKGKTTTTNWVAHFLRSRWPSVRASGNTPHNPLFDALDETVTLRSRRASPRDKLSSGNKGLPAVVELSSWQLEFLGKDNGMRSLGSARDDGGKPDVAVITNIYEDHMNRYLTLREYVRAKANVFRNQNENQILVVNYDNKWTRFFLGLRPKSKLYFFSRTTLPKGKDGIFLKDGICFRKDSKAVEVISKRFFDEKIAPLGKHNVSNFLAAALVAHLQGISWQKIRGKVSTLPQVSFREEVVMKKGNITFINDSAATSPDASIAALCRFSQEGSRLIFITGGTDKELSYKEWAREVGKSVKPSDLFLLEGSATKKMVTELQSLKVSEFKSFKVFGSLEEIVKEVKESFKVSKFKGSKESIVVVFSPGAASFEKFKNEFDRGERFNELVKKIF